MAHSQHAMVLALTALFGTACVAGGLEVRADGSGGQGPGPSTSSTGGSGAGTTSDGGSTTGPTGGASTGPTGGSGGLGGAGGGGPVDPCGGLGGGPTEGMVCIPGGTYTPALAGSPEVTIDAFLMDVTEVTVAAYAECVMAGGCSGAAPGGYCNAGVIGRENHPINCVNADQASAFCASLGKRLPTEDEWEWAARGQEANHLYPWGSSPGPDDEHLCWSGTALRLSSCPVGSFAAGDTALGLKDLSGNEFEWTSTVIAGQQYFRGGGWANSTPDTVTVTYRGSLAPGANSDGVGFRCVR